MEFFVFPSTESEQPLQRAPQKGKSKRYDYISYSYKRGREISLKVSTFTKELIQHVVWYVKIRWLQILVQTVRIPQ